MEHHGWISLLPPLTAIVLALTTRRILISLFVGVVLGALLVRDGYPIAAGYTLVVEYLGGNLLNVDKLKAFAFTLSMGAMVGLITVTGGMRGLVERVLPWAKSRRGGQVLISLLGLAIFFDDYANMLLLGGTTRPLADRLKISREKLAFLIDSTAAPVAGLALVSTWVAVEIDYIGEGIGGLPAGFQLEGIELFLASIPFRFYPLWAILFVFLISGFERDFGPMLTAERKCLDEESSNDLLFAAPQEEAGVSSHWLNAALPILTTVAVVTWWLYYSGMQKVTADELEPTWANIFGNAGSYDALIYGALAGNAIALLMIPPQQVVPVATLLWGMFKGALAMTPALAILWLSGALAATTSGGDAGLGTGLYLAELTSGSIPLWLLPTVTFLVAAAMAFSTGTSWGTMGIVMPLAIPLTYNLMLDNGVSLETSPLLAAVVGTVLAGAIFGDHCSPLSDTTILSSQACGCNHIAHVNTQMPYAMTVGVASIVCGTLPVALGASVWVCHAVGAATLIAVVFFLGKRPSLK
ncbi:Na+/H+ antiporter NhaC family protein [Blastopirellula marina]|uniref:Probable integral membrane protein-putative Na+H+ antiporter n=1 Tax=Blastopirellula marina DSM 3645 TaxID=314230 RepID=A3ZZK6_9BACT|nr:Na+/H+ antiporter NhaC family protein [Blastopirellula marina]EAQ77991.1 probable integral membrane protein-putative Na+H+ antiporter [Blastopirellula marina DSM 3645]